MQQAQKLLARGATAWRTPVEKLALLGRGFLLGYDDATTKT